MAEETKACEACNTNRWHTLVKNVAWACRNCGKPRAIKPELQALLEQQYLANNNKPDEKPAPEKPATPWVEKTDVSDDVSIQLS